LARARGACRNAGGVSVSDLPAPCSDRECLLFGQTQTLGPRTRPQSAHAGTPSPVARPEFQSVPPEASSSLPEDVNRARWLLVTHIAVSFAVFLFLSFLFFSARILFAAFYRSLVAPHTLQFRNIDPIQNHRQLTGAQLHRSCALLHSRHFENPNLEALVLQYEAVPVPYQNLQTISATRTEHK